MEKRDLDGVYFRMGTDCLCFTDLAEEQQNEVMKDRSEEWLKGLCKILAKVIRDIGDEFNIYGERF